jgi:hypothetical protein
MRRPEGDFSPKGNPPALPEDSQILTAPGVPGSLPFVNRSKFTKGDKGEDIRKPETYDMGMQISCGVHSEMSKEGVVWTVATRTRRSVP